MSDLEDNYTKILQNISNLQTEEKDLYTQLEKLASGNNNTNANILAQNDIIKKINNLSNTRIELFKNLAYNYRTVKQTTSNSKYDVIDQITVLKMVEDQLNKSKQYINEIEKSNLHQMRMVEINSYYSKRYSHHTTLIKIIIITCVLILLVVLFKKYTWISRDISNTIISIIILIGLIVFTINGYDLFRRSSMDYDEYDILSIPKNSSESSVSTNKNDSDKDTSFFGCINGNCCSSNMIYDSEKNKCVVMPPESFTTLEMNNVLKSANCPCNSNKSSIDNIYTNTTPLEPIETTVSSFNSFSNYSENI